MSVDGFIERDVQRGAGRQNKYGIGQIFKKFGSDFLEQSADEGRLSQWRRSKCQPIQTLNARVQASSKRVVVKPEGRKQIKRDVS